MVSAVDSARSPAPSCSCSQPVFAPTPAPCGADNLVVIWGPNNSVICAFPNDTVGPQNYDLDPTTLSLVSDSP